MANEHDFDIATVDERTFNLTIGTDSDPSSHSFSLTRNIWNLFNIVLDGLTTSTSWLVEIIQGITITPAITLIIGLTSTIKLKRIVIDTITSITSKLISEIKLVRIVISASFHQIMNFPVTVVLKRILITPAILIMRNIILDIVIPKITIVANTIIGFWRRLWFYDSDALWTMDGVALSDLDYFES